jgi:hypothetical protein
MWNAASTFVSTHISFPSKTSRLVAGKTFGGITAATLRIPQQKFDYPAQLEFAHLLSYDPWHSIPEQSKPRSPQNV